MEENGRAVSWTVKVDSAEKTRSLGRILGECLDEGAVVALEGELGAGKTEMVKGIAMSLGISPEQVTSPTFTLINEYDGRLPLYHFDFYRLSDSSQLDAIGADEYFWGDGVCAVEWADLFAEKLPEEKITVRIEVLDEIRRSVTVTVFPDTPMDKKKFPLLLQKTLNECYILI